MDGISGATLSSNAIKEAVQSVLPEVEAPSEDLAAWAAYEGGFETFLNYMGENATIDAAWAKAAAKQDTTADALKAMWSSLCATTTEGQDTPIASMLVRGNTVTFTDADGNTIAAHPYALVDTVEKGLEGAETFVFHTTDKDAGVFTYLAMMKPDMDGEGSMAAHFHFRYGANEAALDLENPKNMWYPTMCDASVTDAERANVILAMYGIEGGGDENKTQEGSATVEGYGYDAKVLVTFDADGKIISIVDNGTEPGNVNQSFWNTALAMFDKLDGKTKDEVDAVDAVSGATYSSNAIKQAVKNALSD